MPITMKSLGIDQLSVDDRMELLGEIWDSIAANPDDVPTTDAQKQDLRARLEAYQDNPKAGSSWEEVKARLRSIQNGRECACPLFPTSARFLWTKRRTRA